MKMGSAGLNNLILLDQVKGHCDLKGQTDKPFVKVVLEQYRPALEILGLPHGADGGGIIHR